jgi:hypothetical protein
MFVIHTSAISLDRNSTNRRVTRRTSNINKKSDVPVSLILLEAEIGIDPVISGFLNSKPMTAIGLKTYLYPSV